jgi:hypothetical protein
MEAAPLDLHFVGPIRIASFGVAAAQSARRSPNRPLTLQSLWTMPRGWGLLSILNEVVDRSAGLAVLAKVRENQLR